MKGHSCWNELLNQKPRLKTLKLVTSTNRKPYQKLLTWNHDLYSHWCHADFHHWKRKEFITVKIF